MAQIPISQMRRAFTIGSVILPLLVTAAAFQWFPNSRFLGPPLLGSVIVGWAALWWALTARLWLKVAILVIYAVAMCFALTMVMILVYGVPGL